MAGMSRSGCVPVEKKIEQLQNIVNDLTINGLTYTAGCGIDVTGTVITAAIDNVSIICADGVLSAVAASDLTAGCGIDISLGVVSAAVDGTTIICDGGVLSAVPSAIANCFKTITVAGQSDVIADSATDTLTLVGGTGVAITTNAESDTVTFTSTISAGTVIHAFIAHVNEVSIVVGTDASFNFDNTTGIAGTAPASGTALNSATRAFLPGETILVLGDSTPTYHAFKVAECISLVAVNEAAGVALTDSDFNIDGFSALTGATASTGTAVNVPAAQYSDDQLIKVILNDEGDWQPLETYTTAIFMTTSAISARSGTYTWGTGTGKLLKKTGEATHSETGATTGIDLYNTSTSGIDEDRIVQCKKIDGQWFIDVDDC